MKKMIIAIVLIVLGYIGGMTVSVPITITKERVLINGNEYIDINKCIPLSDTSCMYKNIYDYYVIELKDVGRIDDNIYNKSYAAVAREINSGYEQFVYDDEVVFVGKGNKFWMNR